MIRRARRSKIVIILGVVLLLTIAAAMITLDTPLRVAWYARKLQNESSADRWRAARTLESLDGGAQRAEEFYLDRQLHGSLDEQAAAEIRLAALGSAPSADRAEVEAQHELRCSRQTRRDRLQEP